MFLLGFFPAFHVHIDATSGGGDSQQAFDYDRSWSLASYATPWSIATLVGALAVTAVALFAFWRNHTRTALLVVAVLALAGSEVTASPGWYDSGGGVESCSSWSECGGALLNPAVQELHRDALRRPEARNDEYELLPGYSAHPLRSWKLLTLLAGVLLLLAGFLAFRMNPSLVRAGPVLAVLALLAVRITGSGIDCSQGLSSSESAREALALYPVGLAALAGITALTLGRRKLGLLTLALALVIGLWVLLSIAFTCGD